MRTNLSYPVTGSGATAPAWGGGALVAGSWGDLSVLQVSGPGAPRSPTKSALAPRPHPYLRPS